MSYIDYIIRCADGTLYTGITSDLERRLQQHNGERRGGAKYTRGKGPVELVYVEKYETKSEAAQREYQIKHNYSRTQKEELIRTSSEEHIVKSI